MTYTKVDWEDGVTPENAATLGQMDQGIADAHAGIESILAGGTPGGIEYDNAWAAGTAYVPGDVVIHNGIEYLAVNPSTGSTPPAVAPDTAAPLISYGTTFPVAPYDGQEHIYVDSATAPTYSWRFRYVAARATNKWVFIGGPELVAATATAGTLAFTGTATDIPNTPFFTVPLSGEYIQRLMAQMSGTPGVPYICNIDNAQNCATLVAGPASAAATWAHTVATTIKGTLSAGAVIKMRGSSAQAVSFNFAQRSLSLLPIAVAG